MAWALMGKRFIAQAPFTTAVDAGLGPAMRYAHLAIIELCFKNEGYFKLFAIVLMPQLQIFPEASQGHYLQRITGLKDLQLRFRSLNDGFLTSPWGNFESKKGLKRYRQFFY